MSVFAAAAAPDAPAVIVWRVDHFDLHPVPPTGEFYTGDSYVVLNTIRHASGNVERKIYYWQGSTSSVDETAGSAIFSKQLDDAFGGAPLEYREVQGQESDAFRSLFPQGLSYKEGGVSSGLKSAAARITNTPVKLFLVSSSGSGHAAQSTEVTAAVSSLNSGASFVLDDDNNRTVYLWHGASASVFEKTKALELASNLSNSRDLKLVVLDQGDNSADADHFFSLLGATSAAQSSIA